MSTATDERLDLEILEALDFEHVPACEARDGECQNDAVYLTAHFCPACQWASPEAVAYACQPCWTGRSMAKAQCPNCQAVMPHGDAWRIIALVKP